MRRLHLTPHLTTDELEQHYRHAHEATERSWWHILWLVSRGQTAIAIAEHTGYSAYWIGRLVQRYNTEGPSGMVNHRHAARGGPTLLSSTQLDELRQALAGPPPDGELWNSVTVARWMAERLGRPVRKQVGWAYLRRLNARLRAPRPRHVAASAEEQAQFKKRSRRSAEQ